MKILVKKEPFYDDTFNDALWGCDAEFNLLEESNASSVINCVIHAMKLEGYSVSSIYSALDNAMIDLKDEIEITKKFNLDNEDEEEEL